MNTVWILTREHNDYNQYGDYFVAVYKEKPSFEQLKPAVSEWYEPCENSDPKVDNVVGNLLRQGGNRINYEYVWFHLNEVDLK